MLDYSSARRVKESERERHDFFFVFSSGSTSNVYAIVSANAQQFRYGNFGARASVVLLRQRERNKMDEIKEHTTPPWITINYFINAYLSAINNLLLFLFIYRFLRVPICAHTARELAATHTRFCASCRVSFLKFVVASFPHTHTFTFTHAKRQPEYFQWARIGCARFAIRSSISIAIRSGVWTRALTSWDRIIILCLFLFLFFRCSEFCSFFLFSFLLPFKIREASSVYVCAQHNAHSRLCCVLNAYAIPVSVLWFFSVVFSMLLLLLRSFRWKRVQLGSENGGRVVYTRRVRGI